MSLFLVVRNGPSGLFLASRLLRVLLLVFHLASGDVKPVAAHCPVTNLSRREIACDQATTMRACVLMLFLFLDCSIPDAKPVAAHCPVINLSRHDIAGDQAPTMRACVLMLLLFFDSSITDVKPVAAHCPVINLSRHDIAGDQAPTMRACVLMLLLFFDSSVTDVKPVAAHCPVINLSRRDIACDQATTMRACVLMLFLCLDFTVQLLVAGRRLRLAFLLCPFCCFSLSRRNLGPCLRHQPPATLELGPAGRSTERRQSCAKDIVPHRGELQGLKSPGALHSCRLYKDSAPPLVSCQKIIRALHHTVLYTGENSIYIHELFTTHVSFKRHYAMSFVLLFLFFCKTYGHANVQLCCPICSRQPMPCISLCRSSDIARCRLARCRLCEHFLVASVKSFGDVLM